MEIYVLCATRKERKKLYTIKIKRGLNPIPAFSTIHNILTTGHALVTTRHGVKSLIDLYK